MTGMDYDSLAGLFVPFGQLVSVHLIPAKSFSFVSFSSESEAAAAVQALHGQQRPAQDRDGGGDSPGVIYLAYVESLPAGLADDNPWKNTGPPPEGSTSK